MGVASAKLKYTSMPATTHAVFELQTNRTLTAGREALSGARVPDPGSRSEFVTTEQSTSEEVIV